MKVVAALALALLAGSCTKKPVVTPAVATTPTPAAVTVKLTLVPPVVGSVETRHRTFRTDLQMTVQGRKMPMQVDETSVERVAYEEVTDVPQKLLVTYERARKTTHLQGDDRVEPSPVEGRTYELWKEDGRFHAIETGDDPTVDADELDKLSDRFAHEIGQVPGVARILTSRTWTVGKAYMLDPDELEEMSDRKEDGRYTATTVTLTRVEDGNAVFDVRSKVTLDSDEVQGTLEARITATLQVSPARPIEIVTESQIDATAPGGVPFAGTMRGTETYAYEPAP